MARRNFYCSANATDYCFFGGVCLQDTEGYSYCECPSGFMPDAMIFHSKNCAMPTLALPIFCVIFALLWLLVLVKVVKRMRTLRKSAAIAHTLAKLTLATHTALLAIVISYTAERGMFEATLCFCYIYFTLLIVLMSKVTRTMFLFTQGIHRNFVRKWNRRFDLWLLWCAVTLSALTVVAVVKARDRNEDTFVSAMLLAFVAVVDACFLLVVKFLHDFLLVLSSQRSTDNSNNPQDGGHLNKESKLALESRMQRLRRTWGLFLLAVTACCVTFSSVRFALGSFPFLWTLMMCLLLAANSVPIGMLQMFTNGNKDGRERSKTKEGDTGLAAAATSTLPALKSKQSVLGTAPSNDGGGESKHF